MEAATIIWVIGMAILLIYSIISYIKVINNVKTATLIKDNIFETDRITTPFVCGFIKPVIYVPIGMSDKDLSYVLTHEQTHIKRLDYLVKPFAFLVLILHWFNPLMWISFALFSKDMEMSCDESVLGKMGSDIKCSYSNSLLSLSLKRSGLLMGSPLAFGESNTKSRIKNILKYKKPAFWVITIAIIVIAALTVAFTTNPQNKQVPGSITYAAYNTKNLIANKTSYVGDNSKVVELIDAMPLPAGMSRDTVELETANPPYGITINYIMSDASNVTKQVAMSGDVFFRNTVLLFSLVDNVDTINCRIIGSTSDYGRLSYGLTHTREMVEKIMGEDIRHYADSTDTLEKLIDQLNSMSFTENADDEIIENRQIEKYIEIIMSSPMTSSNPYDYINAHRDEYESILKMGDKALVYLLGQFEKDDNNNGLRGYIIMSLCKDLLGDRNNVKGENLLPQDWFSLLSPYEEIKLPDFKAEVSDPIEQLAYDSAVKQYSLPNDGFVVVAPTIFGSYEEENKLKVFVTVFSSRYRLYDKTLSETGGSVIPAAITYTKNTDGSYTLAEYLEAMDGAYWSKSIKEYCKMPVSKKQISGLSDEILKDYGSNKNRSELLEKNLIKHLKSNNQKDIVLKRSTGKLVPLT